MKKIYIVPLYNFQTTEKEIKIYNTSILNKEKTLERANQLPKNISKRYISWIKSLKDSNFFLFTITKKEVLEIRSEFDNVISLLALSYSIYDLRNLNRDMPTCKFKTTERNESIQYNFESEEITRKSSITGSLLKMDFNERWKKFNHKYFWFKLIDIINEKTNTNSRWRKRLYSASVLAGKSQRTIDITYAFLLNIIALEVLLTDQNDKESVAIPERINLIIGWCKVWEEYNFLEIVRSLYRKRCSIVHDGTISDISVDDLILSDEILFNIFNNLIENIDRIQGLNDIKQLKYKVDAYQLLKNEINTELNILPSFSYVKRNYSEDEKKRLIIQ